MWVGTASWTDRTLLESGWYPSSANTAEKRLQHYARVFPLVEVDSTYYFPPTEKNSELWAGRTPAGFKFNIKAFSLLTGHPTKRKALYPEIRLRDGSGNVYLKDLSPGDVDLVWERFLGALQPLAEAGKLGLLLFQFPQWFHVGRANREYILECAARAAPLRICVEFRNAAWMSEDNARKTLDLLEGHNIPYVCVDMPQGFRSSMPPVAVATADIAVVRFHGRNVDGWSSRDIHEKFGYLYREQELREWVPRISDLAERTEQTHVLLNNCYRDYAQRNAAELAGLLREAGAPVVPAPSGS